MLQTTQHINLHNFSIEKHLLDGNRGKQDWCISEHFELISISFDSNFRNSF